MFRGERSFALGAVGVYDFMTMGVMNLRLAISMGDEATMTEYFTGEHPFALDGVRSGVGKMCMGSGKH